MAVFQRLEEEASGNDARASRARDLVVSRPGWPGRVQ